MVRMRSEPRTQSYVARRAAQGMANKEIQRCLKRYIVRELYPLILADLSDAAALLDIGASIVWWKVSLAA